MTGKLPAVPRLKEVAELLSFCGQDKPFARWSGLSERQCLLTALTLNRYDWLWDNDISMPEAMRRISPEDLRLITIVEKLIAERPTRTSS